MTRTGHLFDLDPPALQHRTNPFGITAQAALGCRIVGLAHGSLSDALSASESPLARVPLRSALGTLTRL